MPHCSILPADSHLSFVTAGYPGPGIKSQEDWEGGYFICFLFRERQTGWAFINLEEETLAKSNTQQGLKKQDVQNVMPGFTLVPPLVIRTELERK